MHLRSGIRSAPAPSFSAACRVWLTFGLVSFGGAAAQIAFLHRLVVAERRWVPEQRFGLGLAVALLLGRPEVHKLATWLGFCLHGVAGAMAAGLLFILPGAVAIAVLGAIYTQHAEAPALSALFLGLRGAMLAILTQAVAVLVRRAVRGRGAVAVAACAFAAAFFLRLPAPLIVLAGACVAVVGGHLGARRTRDTALSVAAAAPPRQGGTVAAGIALMLLWGLAVAGAGAMGEPVGSIGRFFAKVSILAFGGAYAMLAWVAEEAVARRGWVTPAELIDGLALAETTPGPTILVLHFLAVLVGARRGGHPRHGCRFSLDRCAFPAFLRPPLPCCAGRGPSRPQPVRRRCARWHQRRRHWADRKPQRDLRRCGPVPGHRLDRLRPFASARS